MPCCRTHIEAKKKEKKKQGTLHLHSEGSTNPTGICTRAQSENNKIEKTSYTSPTVRQCIQKNNNGHYILKHRHPRAPRSCAREQFEYVHTWKKQASEFTPTGIDNLMPLM